jgi:N-acetylmuramic acid 6-phosphate etherase
VTTEGRNARSTNLSKMGASEIVDLMITEEARVGEALRGAADGIAVAIVRVAEAVKGGGSVYYLGAGTSGRVAIQDAAEIPPTFGVADDLFIPYVASGPSAGPAAITTTEDDVVAPVLAIDDASVGSNDAVIGVAASGRTPFVVAGLEAARKRGAWTCGISNNVGVPVLEVAEHPIFLDTGPEILTGSTRLKAGTSAKLVLNMISTGAMVLAGRTTSNFMLFAKPSTNKLRDRCVGILSILGEIPLDEALRMLSKHDWSMTDALVELGVDY